MSDIASRVKAIIVDKLGVDENEVVTEASFTNDLGADSLDTVELIMEFEKEFDIQIPDDQAENIATVGQAVQYISKKQNKKYILYGIKASCSNRIRSTDPNRKQYSRILGRIGEW